MKNVITMIVTYVIINICDLVTTHRIITYMLQNEFIWTIVAPYWQTHGWMDKISSSVWWCSINMTCSSKDQGSNQKFD
jgi:hypothetical protein